MKTTMSAVSGGLYTKLAKPMLFRIAPDSVHEHLLRTGSRLQTHDSAIRLLHGVWSYDNPSRLAQTVCGIDFANPVGLSAGFDKNFELVPTIKAIGCGFMEGGSVTYHECRGNPRPWFHRLPKSKSLVVYAGLANQGVERIIKRLKTYSPGMSNGFPLNISVAKTNSPEACTESDAVADYVGSLRAIKSAQVGDMITLNISCPNTYGGEPFTTKDKLERLLVEVDACNLAQPVFIKMPCHLGWGEFERLL